METFTRLESAVDFVLSQVPNTFCLATPLGLGKPNQLLNLLYDRVKIDKSRHLKIFTALSLDIPDPQSDLERRFTAPFFARHFGSGYPRLRYVEDIHAAKLPSNIEVEEFYFQAGQWFGNKTMQGSYNSLNYTHVVRALFNSNVQIVLQMVAASPDGTRFSLSCNPDLTLDLADLCKSEGRPLMVIGVVHPELPYLGGDAEVSSDFFAAMVRSEEVSHSLFAPPKAPIDSEEYLIGLHASQLIPDGGTLQIGIGSLSEALVYAVLLRHQENQQYLNLLSKWRRNQPGEQPASLKGLFVQPFQQGLYGTSEMIMDGFMHLRKAGVLRREVLEGPEKSPRYLHGAFFLGSKDFYRWLQNLQGEDYSGLSMTRVSKVNDLYDPDEMALRRQRTNARFFNSCMTVTLLGGACSETLENGQVISGVGGQYNFVAMSQELPDSHSILMLRSTRTDKGRRSSNIVWSQGHLTIPRHLRDVVITEYGIAFLRGENDRTVIERLINIADSQFQPELVAIAKKNGKLPKDFRVPEWAARNTAARIQEFVGSCSELFPAFPFGSDFTLVEQRLQKALLQLKKGSLSSLLKLLVRGICTSDKNYAAELTRMGFDKNSKGRLYKQLLLGALVSSK